MALAHPDHRDHNPEGASEQAPSSTRFTHPDYLEIQLRVQEHTRLFFGLPENGVFQAVLATRESRLKGLIAVVTGLPGYRTVPTDTKAYFDSAKNSTNSLQRKLAGTGGSLQTVLDDPTSKLHQVRTDLIETNDPVAQTLHLVEPHQPPIPEEEAMVLAVDSLHFVLKHRKNLTNFPWSQIAAPTS